MDKAFFAVTSNVPFNSEAELHEHYRSDFHRYNLKRRAAGLAPVTKEWFDLRKDKLLSATRGQANTHEKVYYDSLSKKTFNSESKYLEYTNSKKYKKLLKACGGVKPEPIIKTKPQNTSERGHNEQVVHKLKGSAEEEGYESDSWETASEDEMEEMEIDVRKNQWDVCVSFFDNHRSNSLEDNIEYMYKKYGFSIPDVEYLCDPEGLIKYLGAKMSEAHIPFYASGLDADAKSFTNIHAVQRHMIDTGKTRVLYDGNEEEYEDFYDYSALDIEPGEMQLMEGPSEQWVATSNGYELFLPKGNNSTRKVLGSRDLAKYYKQKPKPREQRQSVLVNRIVSRYRILGLLKIQDEVRMAKNDSEMKRRQQYEDVKTHYGISNAVINNLPRNVPY